MSEIANRFQNYNKDHCWQYEIRLQNLDDDLREAGLTKEFADTLTVQDFTFEYVDKTDKAQCRQIVEFIERHEWLGKVPQRLTDRFVAKYRGQIAGTVIMATPNAFTKMLGPETRNIEKLVARGACISWSPKNLASFLIMYSIRYMVEHTQFRLFTAYSDTEAKELGTVYQACNFYYLGKTSGTAFNYFDPKNPDLGWFSDREFRKAGKYRKYAKQLGIQWEPSWNQKWTMFWDKMPPGVPDKLRQAAKDYQDSCEKRPVPSKHKYAYILGKDKRETRNLRRKFEELNPKLANLPYPKTRGE